MPAGPGLLDDRDSSSELDQVSAIWRDLVFAPIETLCILLTPCFSLSVKLCGGIWQVIAAPMLFITDWSPEHAGGGQMSRRYPNVNA